MIERPVTLSDDSRATLTAAAGRAARTNRPRWLIYLGGIAVLAALIYTGVNLTRRIAAQASLASTQARFSEIQSEVTRIRAIQNADDALGGASRGAPDSRMLGSISRIAKELSLVIATEAEIDDPRGSASKTFKRKRYDFKLVNQPAEPVFTWLKRATADLAGVQINRVDISPGDGTDGRPGWNVSVTFTRWERVS